MENIQDTSLVVEAQRRYLNYALSVITSRALPDVRDGLKPVQRRILYTMFSDLHLVPEGRYRKCAKVVGDVMGSYHPHGDTAIYDALVRMAQDFSLRYPLVDGHGNFGSLDGDGAAAYRYTECKLLPLAVELIAELKQRTVDWRPSYDGTKSEPIVLPSRVPTLLVNGAQGIAVGMATSIPPHNLGEVVEACVALIENPELQTKDLCKIIKGPDFPTAGQMLATKAELREIYETGSGSIKLRAEWKTEQPDGPKGKAPLRIIVTSIPYGPTKGSILEKIGEVVRDKKLPQLVDVLDQSTTDVRIELELRRDADPNLVMAYLYKHTPLQQNVQVNLTCLIPTDNPDVQKPERLDLLRCLRYFLDFRFDVVTRRLTHELSEIERRIHILSGYAKIYDALDEVLRIIRRSEGKADAANKLIARFEIDDEQADAILELKLYRLARLEILNIQNELAERRKDQKRLTTLLGSDTRRWTLVKDELAEIGTRFGDKRRTKLQTGSDEVVYDADAFVVDEDANVILTRDGWLKRVREIKDLTATRTREGDEVAAVVFGSTKTNVVFFTNFGSAYTCRIADIPPSAGYGDPVQKLFKFADGERVVAALSSDPRVAATQHAIMLAVSKQGYALRFLVDPYAELSTRSGRKYAKVQEGDEIVGVRPVGDVSHVAVVSQDAHALVCLASEIAVLSNPGRGVTLIKLDDEDRVLGFAVDEPLVVENDKGKQHEILPDRKSTTSRGGKGMAFWRRDRVHRVVPPKIELFRLASAKDMN